MPDPRLVDAREEIKSVLHRRDVAALVFLASETHMDYLLQLEATWTCMQQAGQEFLRFRSLKADYPDKEKQKKILGDSISALNGFVLLCREKGDILEALVKQIGQRVEFTTWNIEEAQDIAITSDDWARIITTVLSFCDQFKGMPEANEEVKPYMDLAVKLRRKFRLEGKV